jgi:hypothetical protein
MGEKITLVQVTELEAQVLNEIAESEYSADGHGLCGYIDKGQFDMKVFRGVLSSLIQKGVIGTQDEEETGTEGHVWAYINSNFQTQDPESESGYKLNNIILP